MDEHVAFLNEQVDRHHAWFSKSLPMIASENVISPMAREMLVSDFGDRYAEGLPHERYYQGNAFVDEVEDRVVALAKQIFRVRHMDPRLISGTVANMAVYFALLEPGDIMTSVALSHGAHISSAKFGAAGLRGVNNVNYPFDVDRMNIDVDETAKLIRLVKPKVGLRAKRLPLPDAPPRTARCVPGRRLPRLVRRGARDGAHRGRDVPGPAPRRGRRLDGLDAQDPPGTAARHPPVRFRGREVPQTAPEGRLPRRRVEPPSARDGGPRGHPRGIPGVRPRLRRPDRPEREGPGPSAPRTWDQGPGGEARIHGEPCPRPGRGRVRRRREGRDGPGEGAHHHEQESPRLEHHAREALRDPPRHTGAHPPGDEGGADAGGRE